MFRHTTTVNAVKRRNRCVSSSTCSLSNNRSNLRCCKVTGVVAAAAAAAAAVAAVAAVAAAAVAEQVQIIANDQV